MIGSIKRLLKDRRGNALAIAGAALPLVVGSAGLATDTIQWVTWKRQLQRAADSAAFAGVYAKAQDASASAAVTTDLANNQHAPANLLTGYPQIAYPNPGSNFTNAVQVTLAIQKRLGFSSIFLSSAPIITVSATAAMVDEDEYCVRALRRDNVVGLRMGGNSQTTLGCKAISNSSACPSVQTMGTSYTFSSTGVAGACTLPSEIIGTPAAELDPYHMPEQDPFANKYPTDIPSDQTCRNMNSQSTAEGTGQDRTFTLAPGCYTDFHITSNGTYHLQPGVYYLDSADFDIQGGATVTGTDVTIILTGTDPGSVTINGTATVQLSAPTTGTYAKMLMIQAAHADTENANTFNGTASSRFDGTFYFPKGNVTLSGTGANTTKCAMIVGYTVDFNGNANIQNNTTGCVANQTTRGKDVRLIG